MRKLTACDVKIANDILFCKDSLYLIMEYDPWKRNDLGCLHALLMLPVMLFKELVRLFKK